MPGFECEPLEKFEQCLISSCLANDREPKAFCRTARQDSLRTVGASGFLVKHHAANSAIIHPLEQVGPRGKSASTSLAFLFLSPLLERASLGATPPFS